MSNYLFEHWLLLSENCRMD